MNEYKTLLELYKYIKKTHERTDFMNYRSNNSWVSISTKEFCEKFYFSVWD